MKLIDLKCPKCGATMKVDSNKEYVFCEHCGTRMIVAGESINQKPRKGILTFAFVALGAFVLISIISLIWSFKCYDPSVYETTNVAYNYDVQQNTEEAVYKKGRNITVLEEIKKSDHEILGAELLMAMWLLNMVGIGM